MKKIFLLLLGLVMAVAVAGCSGGSSDSGGGSSGSGGSEDCSIYADITYFTADVDTNTGTINANGTSVVVTDSNGVVVYQGTISNATSSSLGSIIGAIQNIYGPSACYKDLTVTFSNTGYTTVSKTKTFKRADPSNTFSITLVSTS